VGELYDGTDDDATGRVPAETSDEGLIDLDDVDREPVEVVN
jgi:hypothetical protein